jgi:hypothetical protein
MSTAGLITVRVRAVRESCFVYAYVYLCAVVIALYRAIRVIYLHDVSMIVIGVEGAHYDEEDHLTATWHVGCPYPHKLSHVSWLVDNNHALREFETPAFREMIAYANLEAAEALWVSRISVASFVMMLYHITSP